MAKHYHSQFDERQEMQTSDFPRSSIMKTRKHPMYPCIATIIMRYISFGGDLSYQIGKIFTPSNTVISV